MTQTSPLAPDLMVAVLAFLGVERSPPTLDQLDRLVDRYVRCVPWESAFRIAKRSVTAQTADCPRWPDEFWRDAMERGGGGTCFESNYAFFSLLRGLGYTGYLTINNMGEMCGCHTAIVLHIDPEPPDSGPASLVQLNSAQINNARWLVDVGIPLYTPVPLSVRATERISSFHTYVIAPQEGDIYTVTRDRHPSPYIFTLIDRPIDDETYRAATTNDYNSGGHFLNEVIITRVIDDHVWRFNGRAHPPLLESFGPTPTTMPMQRMDIDLLAERFHMDRDVLARALQAVQTG